MANTYLYRHIRKDTNQVFYVGVGTGRNYERAKTKFGRNPIWHKIVGKTDYEVEIMLDELEREIALEKEKEFIERYGRIDLGTGTLANLTDGGDGCIGFSDEVKKKMSKAQKGNQKWKLRKSNEHSRRLGLSNRGKKRSDEFKRRISEYGKKPVAQYTLDGEFIKQYDSMKATEEYGFNKSRVGEVCNGKRKYHKGYIFKLINKQ